MIAKSHRWQLTAVAVAVLMGLWGTSASALSLGRISVQSALGEPLRAEIEILDINAEEAATLKAKAAPPEAFRTAGLDYNAAMTNLQATLQRRENGRAFLRLSSERVINDPFVDMILEASWNTGRIVRDYTLLFDPPSLRAPSAAPPAASQLPAALETRPAVPGVPTPARDSQLPPRPTLAPKPAPTAPVNKAQASEKPAPQPEQVSSQQLKVKAGDTASRLAAINKPVSVSLDQMLLAMLRANPDAFMGDNVNRIKAGAIVTLPTQEQANATPADQASQTIVAQSRDFNAFRRQLASNAPATTVVAASRTAVGKVQASVEDKKPTAPAPDKLTLSKGAVTGKSAEDQLAQARNTKEASNRTAELEKNIQDLAKLAVASGSKSAPLSTPASSAAQPALPASPALPAPPITLPAAPAVVASATPPASAASAIEPTSAASVPATPAVSAPAAMAAASMPAASAPMRSASVPIEPPKPAAEPGFVDELLENPLLPAGAAALIALLAGAGFYKARQRKKAAALDSAFSDSGMQPESFFGASGGQNVDTNDNPATGSSMVYSPSQLDAIDDVDPVAEADVYMAYGRDLQAEEILKDALRSNPNRLAIHQKLLEIYAKRRDAKAFEGVATLAFNLTNGAGTDWEQVCDKGLALDPDNALYLPGGQPFGKVSEPTHPAEFDSGTPLDADGGAPKLEPTLEFSSTELDLDLDFSHDETAPATVPGKPGTASGEAPAVSRTQDQAGQLPTLTMNLDSPDQSTVASPELDPPSLMGSLDFSLPEPDKSGSAAAFNSTQAQETKASTARPDPNSDSGMLEFDLGSLSLDLGDEPITESGALPNALEDPLETKLALAEEFKAIGDDDGARALIEEVIAEAAGIVKTKAQQALGRL